MFNHSLCILVHLQSNEYCTIYSTHLYVNVSLLYVTSTKISIYQVKNLYFEQNR